MAFQNGDELSSFSTMLPTAAQQGAQDTPQPHSQPEQQPSASNRRDAPSTFEAMPDPKRTRFLNWMRMGGSEMHENLSQSLVRRGAPGDETTDWHTILRITLENAGAWRAKGEEVLSRSSTPMAADKRQRLINQVADGEPPAFGDMIS